MIVPTVVQESLTLQNAQNTTHRDPVVVGVGQSIKFHVSTIYGGDTKVT